MDRADPEIGHLWPEMRIDIIILGIQVLGICIEKGQISI